MCLTEAACDTTNVHAERMALQPDLLCQTDSHSQVCCRWLQDSWVATLHTAACSSPGKGKLDADDGRSSSLCCRYLRESLVAALRNPMETFQRRARFINYGELPGGFRGLSYPPQTLNP